MAGATLGVGLVGAVLALTLRPADTTDPARLEALERRLALLEQQVAGLDTLPVETTPATGDRRPPVPAEAGPSQTNGIGQEVVARLQQVEHTVAAADRALSDALEKRVEAVVDEKVTELEMKQIQKLDKKPSLEVFSEILGLTEYQVRLVNEEVWLGQDDVRAILEIPTAGGANLVDELVEVVAYGEAKHPEAGPRFMEWLGRVVSEKIPGTEVTYGAEVEAAKNNVRAAFRREFTEEQYAEFEGWGVDPVEIKEIEDSPWSDFEERVGQRVRELTR
jgi:hypothetical protein